MSNLFVTNATGSVTIVANAVTVPISADKMLCFQRQYREYWIESCGIGSFSRAMIPDVVIAGTNFDGPEWRMIVLDAKYRIDSGLNEALNSIHTYLDALVQEVDGDRVEGIVAAAYLLTPHVPTLDSSFRATKVPGRLFHPQYREKFRFGAMTLRPGMSSLELRTILKTIVADSAV